MRGQLAKPLQLQQQFAGQHAAAGAGFEDLRSRIRHDLRRRHGQGARKQRRDFRRSDKVAGCTEFLRAATVVAEPRRVERQFHVAGKGNPAAGCGDFVSDVLAQRIAGGARIGGRFG